MNARQGSTDHTKGPRNRLEPEVGGRKWAIERTADLETLWEEIGREEFGDDERLPYWAELWPASLLLGEWLHENADRVAGRRCLDLGCGLGLTAIIGAHLGGLVAGMDYEWPAVFFARENWRLNEGRASGPCRSPLWLQMDWRRPAFRTGTFECMWGGDILYEKRFFLPLANLMEDLLAPGGVVWMGEPVRTVSRPVWDRLAERGWRAENVMTGTVRSSDHGTTVRIWELTRQAAGK